MKASLNFKIICTCKTYYIACQDIPRMKYLNVFDAFENKDKQTTSNKTKPLYGEKAKTFLFPF